MANKATAEGVRADMAPPNYRGAVQQIRTTKAKKDRVSGINGEIAGVYAKVEGFKVNRKAGKIFYALDNMEPDERADVLRSLNGLNEAAGWDEMEDLVDAAEGKVVPLRQPVPEGSACDEIDEALANEAAGDDVDEALGADGPGDDFEATDEELAAQIGRTETKAKDRARGQLDKPAGKKPSISEIASPPKVPFTGDNSDLANQQGNA